MPKFLILILEGIIKKISYEHRNYGHSLRAYLWVCSEKVKKNSGSKGLNCDRVGVFGLVGPGLYSRCPCLLLLRGVFVGRYISLVAQKSNKVIKLYHKFIIEIQIVL